MSDSPPGRTPSLRPFRFLAEAVEVVDGRTFAERARKAEDLGYSVLLVTDHLLDQVAPIPAMATIAAATEKLRVGTFVLNNDLRHPAVLAHELATLDVRIRDRAEVSVDELLESPSVFVGSVDGLVEKFQALRERFGISSIMVGDIHTLAPVVSRLAGT